MALRSSFMAAIALLVVAGCGDETSLSLGRATIDGTIAGSPLEPVSVISGTKVGYTFVFTRLETTHTAVAISDFPDRCGTETVIGRTLYLSLFENPTLPVSVVSQPGTFDVWLPALDGQSDPGPGNRAIVQFMRETNDGGYGQLAQSGTVTVERVSSEEISGSFDVMIGSDHVTGSFRAPICEPWTRSGDIPAPSS